MSTSLARGLLAEETGSRVPGVGTRVPAYLPGPLASKSCAWSQPALGSTSPWTTGESPTWVGVDTPAGKAHLPSQGPGGLGAYCYQGRACTSPGGEEEGQRPLPGASVLRRDKCRKHAPASPSHPQEVLPQT